MTSVPRLAWARYLWLVTLTAAGACSCDEGPLTPALPGSCEPTYVCPTGYEYRQGGCLVARCGADKDCCPGQKCNVAAGFCGDQFVSCSDDSACTMVPGQKCIDFRGGRYCGYPNKGQNVSLAKTQGCSSNADCDDGRVCFGSRCVTQAPCEGGCEAGSICDVDSNTCFPMATCDKTCEPGQILVVENPDTMSGPLCCALACKCETLPPVKAGQYGWYASLALTADEVVVSAYDPGYGDLVCAHFDLNGRKKSVEYVDGFPTSGAVVGDPMGPRGGRAENGPDVGAHTSIVVDSTNAVHVAYYDRARGALKYALFTGGRWRTMVVDDEGDVGLYTSIAIAPDGNPRISYMMADGLLGADPNKRTGLKVATARTNQPSSTSDWSTEILDTRLKPVPLCGGGCPSDQACVDLGGGPACAPTTIGCGACMSGEVCVERGMGMMPACEARVAVVPLDDFIEGTGLFTSLAFTSTGTPVIAYYDRIDRDVRLVKGDGRGGWGVPVTVDGNDAMRPTDVGQHVSLAIAPGNVIALAYFDATNDDLVYYDVNARTREVVDNGVTPPNLRMVGADAALIFDDVGRPAIAYQDPTNIDLIYARKTGSPAMWSTEVLRGETPMGARRGMASGFYASQARRANRAYISNVDVTFDADSELLLDLRVITKSLD